MVVTYVYLMPNNEAQAYYNYKNFHSIQLQAVCLYDRKLLDIFVG